MKTDRRGRLRYTPEQKNTMVEAYLASGLSITDLRTGAAGMVTNTSFSESGQVLSSTQGGRTTSFEFDKLGRVVKVDAPNTYDPAGSPGNTDRQNITRTSYWPTGQVKAVWGDGTYPTVRVYDDQNRLKELRTFRGWTHTTGATGPDESTVGADITLWFHDPVTGRLLLKTYPDGEDADTARDSGPEYHYTPGGRLKSRTWARGSHTRYDYAHGQLTHVRYFTSAAADTGTNPGNDPATPDVVRSYDALGRPQSVSSSVSQSQFAYDDTSTTNPPHVATRTLDTETLTIDPDGTGGLAPLTRVIDRATDALLRPGGYSLLAGGTTEATAGYHYSTTHGGLLGISAAGVPNLSGKSYAWEYTRMAGNASLIDTVSGPVHLVDNTWDTTRDVMLSKANTTVVNGGTVDVSTIAYTVNAIGQREAASRSGSATNSTVWHYDPLGQVIAADDSTNTSDRAYAYDSIGNRTKTASGTLALPTSPTYTSNALNQYTAIPEAPAQQLYDADGNMTRGRVPQISVVINLVWDGENRLVEVNVPGVSIVKYAYDAMGRRVVKTTPTATTLYLYDGWNVIAEYTVSNSQYQLFKSYLWGLDLSGTMQGAGGVGGLLAVKQGSALHYPAYDGNGNVTEYLDANKAVAARFEYDPFGNTVVNTDTTGQFPYRFSTKPVDAETGLHYYGYRWYNSLTGRWPSRDPIEEEGGVNMYGFVGNDGISWVDFSGLYKKITPGEFVGGYHAKFDWEIEWECEGDRVQQFKDHDLTIYSISSSNLVDFGFSIGPKSWTANASFSLVTSPIRQYRLPDAPGGGERWKASIDISFVRTASLAESISGLGGSLGKTTYKASILKVGHLEMEYGCSCDDLPKYPIIPVNIRLLNPPKKKEQFIAPIMPLNIPWSELTPTF